MGPLPNLQVRPPSVRPLDSAVWRLSVCSCRAGGLFRAALADWTSAAVGASPVLAVQWFLPGHRRRKQLPYRRGTVPWLACVFIGDQQGAPAHQFRLLHASGTVVL